MTVEKSLRRRAIQDARARYRHALTRGEVSGDVSRFSAWIARDRTLNIAVASLAIPLLVLLGVAVALNGPMVAACGLLLLAASNVVTFVERRQQLRLLDRLIHAV
ncbi:hypothetical protein [Smaragdicoccus niigatensis]|uniref:hypothetical protein n=1 Tax=Smaragdicoccus niigatensis TaxID=359359 RepID=UPI00035F25DA|nr:hypothetical protein [Smaragdicoccus niigatensis]